MSNCSCWFAGWDNQIIFFLHCFTVSSTQAFHSRQSMWLQSILFLNFIKPSFAYFKLLVLSEKLIFSLFFPSWFIISQLLPWHSYKSSGAKPAPPETSSLWSKQEESPVINAGTIRSWDPRLWRHNFVVKMTHKSCPGAKCSNLYSRSEWKSRPKEMPPPCSCSLQAGTCLIF